MFKDYYKTLSISPPSNFKEIKNAFKTLAIKYHPDKNLSTDTTKLMQGICEAYMILKNPNTKEKYDKEYTRYYKDYKKGRLFSYEDQVLKDYIDDILIQIEEYAQTVMKETSQLTKIGFKAAGDEVIKNLISYLIFGLIVVVIFIIAEANGCK